MRSRLAAALRATVLFGLAAAPALAQEAEPLLPDITVRRSDLFDNDLRTVGGRLLLRVSNGTPNIGRGPFYVYGAGSGGEREDIRQRVYRDDGSFFERTAGSFVYHPQHNHIHIENWAQFRLRAVVGDDGVGDVVAEGEKTSFCILDLAVHDRNLPGFDSRGQFRSCSSRIQGLSVGWVDIYDKSLPGQSIDITDVPDGHYWLEAEVDPENHFLELDEENNVERIRITVGNPTTVNPDAFEPNDDVPGVASLREGGPNSPNLGPCDPKRTIEGLTLHGGSDQDWFRFYINSVGSSSDFVRVDFRNAVGNVDLALLDDEQKTIATSETTADSERISLEGLPAGWYWVRVYGRLGARSPRYTLTINPPADEPPTISVSTPVEGETRVRHGLDLFLVNWEASDPEEGPTWVSVYFSEERNLDDAELVPTTLHTPGDLDFVVVNTAEVAPGTYHVWAQITDGGTTRGAWAPGTLSIIELSDKCIDLDGVEDCNENNVRDGCDIGFGSSLDCNENGVPDECDIASGTSLDRGGDGIPDECEMPRFHRGDANGNDVMDISDGVTILSFLFEGSRGIDCLEAADVNNDAAIDVTDVIFSLGFLFLGGDAPPPPGPPGGPCGTDTDAPGSAGDLGCESYSDC